MGFGLGEKKQQFSLCPRVMGETLKIRLRVLLGEYNLVQYNLV